MPDGLKIGVLLLATICLIAISRIVLVESKFIAACEKMAGRCRRSTDRPRREHGNCPLGKTDTPASGLGLGKAELSMRVCNDLATHTVTTLMR